ncbi:MAG: four helix bundle protein, partial [Alphaproteobacteria bacterium]|nr:four helix bundle protein [Alphaproteobacteria bacterium]
MVMYNQLPIYRDSYILLTEIYKVTNKFSRDYKYTLGQDMKRDCLGLFRYLYLANTMPKQRQEYIDQFLASFEL